MDENKVERVTMKQARRRHRAANGGRKAARAARKAGKELSTFRGWARAALKQTSAASPKFSRVMRGGV
jgi:hypothetical protein